MDMYEEEAVYWNSLKKSGYQTYINHLKERLDLLNKIQKHGSHGASTSYRIVLWGCSCNNEDNNATKCNQCYNITLIANKIFNQEIIYLEQLLNYRTPINTKRAR